MHDGAILRQLVDARCLELGISRRTLARRAGVDRARLYRAMRGAGSLSDREAQLLANELRTTTDTVRTAATVKMPTRRLVRGPSTLATLVQEALATRGWSVADLANIADRHDRARRVLFDTLAGTKEPRPATIALIGQILELPMERLLIALGIQIPTGLAGRLLIARWQHGLSIEELATQARVFAGTLVAVESGTMPLTHRTATAVADVLGVPLDEVADAYPAPEALSPMQRLITDRMRRLGLVQGDLAAILEMTNRQLVSRWIVGQELPGEHLLAPMARALQTPLEQLRSAWRDSPPALSTGPFAHELTACRTRAGLTRRAAARAAEIATSTWNRWERGECLPQSPEMLRRLLRVLRDDRETLTRSWLAATQIDPDSVAEPDDLGSARPPAPPAKRGRQR